MTVSNTALKLTDNSKVKFKSNHYNTFGLQHGRPETGGTCPGSTVGVGGCLNLKRANGSVATCYVDKLAKAYPAFGKVLHRNTELLLGKTQEEMEVILAETIASFIEHNKGRDLTFRLHTSGDFFSEEYARAWANTITKHPNIRFWTYTRSLWAVPLLMDCSNLSMYISSDPVNYKEARLVYDVCHLGHTNVGICFMGNKGTEPTEEKWVVCPEISGKLKSESSKGACAKCKLCMTYNGTVRLRNIQFPVH
jgi:hypothetical protein